MHISDDNLAKYLLFFAKLILCCKLLKPEKLQLRSSMQNDWH